MNNEIYVTIDYFNELEQQVQGIIAHQYLHQFDIKITEHNVNDSKSAEIMMGNKSIKKKD